MWPKLHWRKHKVVAGRYDNIYHGDNIKCLSPEIFLIRGMLDVKKCKRNKLQKRIWTSCELKKTQLNQSKKHY